MLAEGGEGDALSLVVDVVACRAVRAQSVLLVVVEAPVDPEVALPQELDVAVVAHSAEGGVDWAETVRNCNLDLTRLVWLQNVARCALQADEGRWGVGQAADGDASPVCELERRLAVQAVAI